ncbi:hypothetical protein KAX08_07540 [candidate division WOR-3 bacterium]|nr:hypothetical protein [candidate division WOR-3 bacterium]
MSIRIKELNVKNLGPIKKLNLVLKSINLIYGDNERGKSYLVEFLIRSLFKTAGWKLRKKTGSGKVLVEGLDDKIIEFSPSKSVKLEDFLSEKYVGLPPDFSKLLIFRSTNVELGEEKESDKIMLRRFLSHKEIFDKIKDNISKTIIDSKIDGYKIEGAKRAEIQRREDLMKDMRLIDELFQEIENKYMGGERRNLEDEKKKLKNRFDKLEKAKRHISYKISKEIESSEKKATQVDEKSINYLLKQISNLNIAIKKYENKKEDLNILLESTKNYKWLKSAISEYEKYNFEEITEKPNIWYTIFFALIFALIVTFTVLKSQVGIIISLLGLAGIVLIYKRRYDKFLADAGKRDEILNLKNEFKERFNEKLKNLAIMNEKIKNMEDDYNKREVIQGQLKDEKSEIDNTKLKIAEEMKGLLGKGIGMEKWMEELEKKLEERRRLKEQISNKNVELARLDVEEPDYIKEKQEVEYNKDEYIEVKEDLEKIKESISKKEEELKTLKHSICKHTKDNFSIEWTELIKNLADKHNEVLSEYKNLTAEIIGKKYVSEIIEELYKEEDEKIKDALESEIISNMLPQVTTHYENISLTDDRMIVSDTYNDFPVESISDGAKEQVFLALRIGLAKHWFKKDELFLIFDDAFLHSDYNRRPLLLDKLIELANSGWQIICFTFDDNIRNLIDKKVKKLKDEYRFYNLNEI